MRIPAALTPLFRKVLTPQFRSIDPTPCGKHSGVLTPSTSVEIRA